MAICYSSYFGNGMGVIGATYMYYGSDKKFVLKEIGSFTFLFECGHWCTDCVFEDLIQTTLF